MIRMCVFVCVCVCTITHSLCLSLCKWGVPSMYLAV